jgi:ribosomal protein L29
MKLKDLRKKTVGELEKELKDKVELLSSFRLGISNSKVKNVKNGKNLRKEIARIHTLLKEAETAKA